MTTHCPLDDRRVRLPARVGLRARAADRRRVGGRRVRALAITRRQRGAARPAVTVVPPRRWCRGNGSDPAPGSSSRHAAAIVIAIALGCCCRRYTLLPPSLHTASAIAIALDCCRRRDSWSRRTHPCVCLRRYVLADMAHVAGLVAGGAAESPFAHAHVVTTTAHKSLRGPRAAMIFYRLELKEAIDFAVFPMLQVREWDGMEWDGMEWNRME